MAILVTGGTGYIGSHTCVELIKNNYEVVILDNLFNSKLEVLDQLEAISGTKPKFYEVDLLNIEAIRTVFKNENIEGVIHFAGYKAVGESVAKPLEYYENNIGGTINLCYVMAENNVKKFVFSSSASVYGETNEPPFHEEMPLSATNPYGQTKLMIEQILKDLCVSEDSWEVISLRYFNPIGAHASGLIGEDPNGIPNNLIPIINQVAAGQREQLSVFGDDYDTVDGTGVRDYIHVVDLAKGHVKAFNYLAAHPGYNYINLGTGSGQSVVQVIQAFEKVNDLKIPYSIVDRRPGDIAASFANCDKATSELSFKAELGIDDMCKDSWRYKALKSNIPIK
jgi:UDP-glucose 4-epimerase